MFLERRSPYGLTLGWCGADKLRNLVREMMGTMAMALKIVVCHDIKTTTHNHTDDMWSQGLPACVWMAKGVSKSQEKQGTVILDLDVGR